MRARFVRPIVALSAPNLPLNIQAVAPHGCAQALHLRGRKEASQVMQRDEGNRGVGLSQGMPIGGAGRGELRGGERRATKHRHEVGTAHHYIMARYCSSLYYGEVKAQLQSMGVAMVGGLGPGYL